VFEAFCLQITYDKPNRRIEISATITEAIADALENRVGAGLNPTPPTPPGVRVRTGRFAWRPGDGGRDR
jgi:hypothetical protein